MKSKQCSKCKEVKPVTEFYHDKNRKDGHCYWCKGCIKSYQKPYMKIYYQTPEVKARQKAYMKAYRQTPKYKAYMKARRQTPEHKSYRRAYMKAMRQTPEHKAYQEAYRKDHEAYLKSYQSAYNKTAKGKARVARNKHKRRTLIKELPCTLTAEQWEEIKASQDYRCAMCGKVKPLARDHIFPLSKGGAFTKSNIQGLCRSCNSKKSNKIIDIIEQPKLRQMTAEFGRV